MSPKPPDEQDSSDPTTPRKASAARKNNNNATTTPRRVSGVGGVTPNSAPAATRERSATMKKPEPTLLADFLLGRPSPQRIAAERQKQRRKSLGVALPAEVRQSSVQKLQQPSGPKDRVKTWQKANAAAMARGNPLAAPSEPTEIAFPGEEESVTEEDRVRIKMRQKKRPPKVVVHNEDDEEYIPHDPRLNGPPPKRVVSDDHWMAKKKGKSPPRSRSPKDTSISPSPIPKDFLQKTAANPPVAKKIQDWAMRIEEPNSTPPAKQPRAPKSRDSGDGIRVQPMSGGRDETDRSQRKPSRPRGEADDGIRITPTRKKRLDDDGIRVRPLKTYLPDDGIRITPSQDTSTINSSRSRHTERSRPPSSSRWESSSSNQIEVMEDPSERIEVMEESDSAPETPTRRPSGGKSRKSSQPRSYATHSRLDEVSDDRSWVSTSDSAVKTYLDDSERGSSAPTSSLADIPVGYSAFSELDLSHGADAQNTIKRRKAQRTPSFKAVPKVFKKVVSEGKKILQDAVEPPKPAVSNQPPSIENWLSGTVDPFVDAPAAEESPVPKRKSIEKEWAQESQTRRRSSVESKPKKASPPGKAERKVENDENAEPKTETREEPVKTPKTPTSAGLKRSRATRGAASPLKSSGKKPFREVLKEAFKGESSGHKYPPTKYPSCKDEPDYDSYEEGDEEERREDRRRSTGSADSYPSEEPPSPPAAQQKTPTMAGPRRKPPTNGLHELSTIASVESFSTHESDMSSQVSDTTVTQSTAFTKDTEVSRQRSQKSGLKRRLTKHSDLVSVLSLTNDREADGVLKAIRSRPSLRRSRSRLDTVTVDDLLGELADDENLYQRELKTLVDGVVPVLLTTVVHGDSRSSVNLFGPDSPGRKANNLSKAVVSMGVALEKLKNSHRKAPVTDIHRLLSWLHTLVPIYDSYLDAWRLGFQDLIVNLAPAAGRLDDEDSLVNALPRNEDGDVINEDGERVDVAHLLKRPVLRIKMLVKFIKGVHAILSSYETLSLCAEYDSLQEKAKRRHKEESARLADEDATNTDTSRARDLRTLAPMDSVKIDPNKQVNAKDLFSLNLAHSNGQRLECQVELVYRDNPDKPNEKGDLLIRETGDGRQSWLLFPPMAMASLSARKGKGQYELVVMFRGTHNGRQWYELITLCTDNEEQVMDWLDILGTLPVPPIEKAPTVTTPLPSSSSPRAADVPVGGKLRKQAPVSLPKQVPSPEPTTPPKRAVPSRYHPRGASMPTTPVATSPSAGRSPSPEKTPTQRSYDATKSSGESSSRPLSEDLRPEPSKLKKASPNSTPFRQDGAPPPPVHRTLKSPKAASNPPVELKSSRVKRRTSSPLKHEYLPSDESTEHSETASEDSDIESSDDEMEGTDVPETELGISIKAKNPGMVPTESLVSESTCSLTPSNSASQAGMHGRKSSSPENVHRYMAQISYWSEKRGVWKDISTDPCSILVGPGIIEAFALTINSPGKRSSTQAVNGSGSSQPQALISLELTPVVLLRQSTVVDLEIRSAVRDDCQHKDLGGGNFRFRCPSSTECFNLYMAVHHARLNNQKYIQLENDTRFQHFGERNAPTENDGDTSSRRRSWFGRKNSYRASTRAPSQGQEGSVAPSSSVSASSFLKRLTGGGNLSFNIAGSSVDKQSHFGSGNTSLYTSGSSSSGGASPRSPSISLNDSTSGRTPLNSDNIKVRLHLLVSAAKWEDYGNCILQIRRPPPGWHQELRAYHGLEKRVTVTTVPKKDSEKPRIVLDAVLGSGCFTPMGRRGIVCGIWEELRDENGEIGVVPATGGSAGTIKKWCFQCGSVGEADWVLRLVHQEVLRA